MSDAKPKCPKCGGNQLAVERRMNGNAKCFDCAWKGPYAQTFAEFFDSVRQKEIQWFKDRGMKDEDIELASDAFKKYLASEGTRPFDKAPGFRRMFMVGHFYGFNE